MSVNKDSKDFGIHSKSDLKDQFINGRYTNKGFVDTENLDQEKENEEKTEPEIPPVGFFQLFRYASRWEMLLITIAVTIAVLSGAAMPAIMIILEKSSIN
ncbi:hypothetical protein CEXT_669891 [Caerostris extrusa]|uniref:Uncharacterized protein n=1 Tax=Caerostris extrusa TaxID=172846 RepID=A0AAV4XFD5_CAEEX|nr:hypothetical protein CEXT_669891 [Caerostris extrusa]